ncbi:MAG: calcineurin-like phosphoesterase C-terminal domain-containing protein [Alistipes sp.]|nr:calcineurin-like phosphoesterase C-terminal domain-containing protein [Alistipes sp.]
MRKFLVLVAMMAAISFTAASQVKVSGTILDEGGKPVVGVAVTDGFTVVQTNAKGKFAFKTSPDATYVYYSIPAEYKVNVKDGHPDFYQRIERGKKRYDFTLNRLENGPEKTFRLIAVADPQAQCMFHVKRFSRETVVDIRQYVDSQTQPRYGVTLGDIGYTEGPFDCVPLLDDMRAAMAYDKTHLLFFQTYGNHDHIKGPVAADERSSTFNLAYQRAFEDVFGPIDYSWNRGDVHIVSMRNIQYDNAQKANKYKPAFTREQYEWVKADLALVPRDKMVILCLHIGMYDRTFPYLAEVRQLLTEFKESHIFVGHTHFMNHHRNGHGTYEHVHAAASGSYWWSSTNGDGTPNGYTIYDIEGNTLKNWRYKGTGHDISYQIRMYRGDAEFGGEFEKFRFPYSHNTILANVFMADPDWKVELYEDGVLTGSMKRIPVTKDKVPELNSSRDWWAVGYHIGVVGRSYGHVKDSRSKMNGGGRKGYLTSCNHLYRLELKNPDAREIKVVATDTNGNVYEQTRFTESGDYSENALMNELIATPRKVLNETY